MDNHRYISKKVFKMLNNCDIIKFLYLCSFADQDGELVRDNHLILKSQLPQLLNLAATSVFEFLNHIDKAGLVSYNKLNSIYLNKKYYSYIKKVDYYEIDGDLTKEIYAQLTPRDHKKIGEILTLYEYVNNDGYIINDGSETIIEKQQFLSYKKISEIMNVDYDNCCKKFNFVKKIKVGESFLFCREDNKSRLNMNWINPFGKRRTVSWASRSDINISWRNSVIERDGHGCIICGRNFNLQAHHILNYSRNKELRNDVTNGITLCECHHSSMILNGFHQIYGTRNNTKEQLQEYVTNQRKLLELPDINIDDIINKC